MYRLITSNCSIIYENAILYQRVVRVSHIECTSDSSGIIFKNAVYDVNSLDLSTVDSSSVICFQINERAIQEGDTSL